MFSLTHTFVMFIIIPTRWITQSQSTKNPPQKFYTSPLPNLGLQASVEHPLQLHGVFDGHGSDHTAKYVSRRLPQIIRENLERMNNRPNNPPPSNPFESGPPDRPCLSKFEALKLCLVLSFEQLDIEYLSKHWGADSGSVAVVVLLDCISKRAICANLG